MQSTATISLPEELLEVLAQRVAELVHARKPEPSAWLDVGGTATHLSTTPAAVRKLVQRQAIPVHRLGGRLLFDRQELDAFVRAGDGS